MDNSPALNVLIKSEVNMQEQSVFVLSYQNTFVPTRFLGFMGFREVGRLSTDK